MQCQYRSYSLNSLSGFPSCKHISPYTNTNTNTQLQIYKYKYTLYGFPSCKHISPPPMLRDLGTHGVRMITEIAVDSVCADCSCYNCHIIEQIQLHKYKYANTNIQIQIHIHKYTDITTQIQIH